MQVWDVLKGEGLVNYRGHGNRVMCVEWSPVDPDVVWTGADDFTVHEWKPSKQEFTAPPKGEEQDYSLVLVGLEPGPIGLHYPVGLQPGPIGL